MSMKALNRLLGWSTLEPKILQAYSEGRIDEMLVEYDFSPELRRQLRELKTDSFCEFALNAYRLVEAADGTTSGLQIPSPMDGLQDAHISDREQVA
jgi:hypothetical protein